MSRENTSFIYFQKNLPCARADLLRGIYLDPNMEEAIMLSARLYPNENIDAILAAKSSQKVRRYNLITDIFIIRHVMSRDVTCHVQ